MRQAMFLTTLGLLVLGCRPNLLYHALPHAVEYTLYTPAHVVEQLLILSFTVMAFVLARRWRLLPKMVVNVWDVDHLQRAVPGLWLRLQQRLAKWRKRAQASLGRLTQTMTDRLARDEGEESVLVRHWQTGNMALWVAISLAGYLLLYFV
jgi:multicomponent Na+:H+ antiporter subunit D